MYVRELSLTDFRSYAEATITFEQGVSVLVGPNGHGKTNVVEAINYVATLASHRVASDAPLVRSGAARAVVRSAIVHNDRELAVDLEISPGKASRARLNRVAVPRRQVLGALRTVLFAPEDLVIVRGDPGDRRRFLDALLIARYPRFAGIKADYDRALKQRTALLKTVSLARRGGATGDLRTLDVWDGHVAEHGAQLVTGRLELVAALSPYLAKAYDEVSAGKGAAAARYRPALGTDEEVSPGADVSVVAAQLAAGLARNRAAEVERGVTLVGPHRDELELRLGELPVRGYASHGESWSFALALRLASYELLAADGGEPVLILDDVFAELDTGRRDRLAALVSGADQLLITAAVAADVPEELAGARYDVAFGQVSRVR